MTDHEPPSPQSTTNDLILSGFTCAIFGIFFDRISHPSPCLPESEP